VSALILFVMFFEGNSFGFGIAGHYATSALIIADTLRQPPAPFTKDQSALVAFCSELPDEATELDAAHSFGSCLQEPLNLVEWFVSRHTLVSPGIRRVLTVQQLLHGLTGGNASQTRTVSDQIIEDLLSQVDNDRRKGKSATAEELCALGFAIHLRGDAVAHIVLSDSPTGANSKMYETGLGHTFALHYPDYLLYENSARSLGFKLSYTFPFDYLLPAPVSPGPRAQEWKRFVYDLKGQLTGCQDPNAADCKEKLVSSALPPLIDKILKEERTAAGGDYDESEVSTELMREVSEFKYQPKEQTVFGDEMHCQDYVNKQIQQNDFGNSVSHLDCAQTWQIYRHVAECHFKNNCPNRPDNKTPEVLPKEYVPFVYSDPLFYSHVACQSSKTLLDTPRVDVMSPSPLTPILATTPAPLPSLPALLASPRPSTTTSSPVLYQKPPTPAPARTIPAPHPSVSLPGLARVPALIDIFFEHDTAVLCNGDRGCPRSANIAQDHSLQMDLEWIKQNAPKLKKIKVEAYADVGGNSRHNEVLKQERTRNVIHELRSKGVGIWMQPAKGTTAHNCLDPADRPRGYPNLGCWWEDRRVHLDPEWFSAH